MNKPLRRPNQPFERETIADFTINEFYEAADAVLMARGADK
jgi:hypothetical protein